MDDGLTALGRSREPVSRDPIGNFIEIQNTFGQRVKYKIHKTCLKYEFQLQYEYTEYTPLPSSD